VDTTAWAARGLAHRVACQGGAGFRFDGGADDHLRLGFAACNEAELDEAVERLAAALPA
jgi:DNA-binding transcriptional MocR family regulator